MHALVCERKVLYSIRLEMGNQCRKHCTVLCIVIMWYFCTALCQVVLDSYIVLYFLFQNGLVFPGIGRIVFSFICLFCLSVCLLQNGLLLSDIDRIVFFVCFAFCLFVCFRTALFYLTSIVFVVVVFKYYFSFSFFGLFVCFRTALFYLASLVVFLLSMYDVSTQCIRDSNSVCQPLKELFSLLTLCFENPSSAWNR